GRRLYDPERHRYHRLLYGGHDPGVCARQVAAMVELLLGYPDQGLASITDASALAERIEHPLSLVTVHMFAARFHLDRGAPESALQCVEAAEVLATEQRLAFFIEPGILRGAAMAALGAKTDGINLLREGLAQSAKRGATLWQPS